MTPVADKGPRVVVPAPLSWRRRAAVTLLIGIFRICIKTWRKRWQDAEASPVTPGPVIYCIWHNRLPLGIASYDKFIRLKWPAAGLVAIISASRDGSTIAAIASSFGIATIRGSTSRRGPQALLEATTWLEKGYSVVITPDGPRGPAYRVQEGIIKLAQLTGRPIIPISNYARWKVRLNSWDRFQIPLPFARCEIRHGEPMRVARETSDAQRAQLCRQLEEAMMRLTQD